NCPAIGWGAAVPSVWNSTGVSTAFQSSPAAMRQALRSASSGMSTPSPCQGLAPTYAMAFTKAVIGGSLVVEFAQHRAVGTGSVGPQRSGIVVGVIGAGVKVVAQHAGVVFLDGPTFGKVDVVRQELIVEEE